MLLPSSSLLLVLSDEDEDSSLSVIILALGGILSASTAKGGSGGGGGGGGGGGVSTIVCVVYRACSIGTIKMFVLCLLLYFTRHVRVKETRGKFSSEPAEGNVRQGDPKPTSPE